MLPVLECLLLILLWSYFVYLFPIDIIFSTPAYTPKSITFMRVLAHFSCDGGDFLDTALFRILDTCCEKPIIEAIPAHIRFYPCAFEGCRMTGRFLFQACTGNGIL